MYFVFASRVSQIRICWKSNHTLICNYINNGQIFYYFTSGKHEAIRILGITRRSNGNLRSITDEMRLIRSLCHFHSTESKQKIMTNHVTLI